MKYLRITSEAHPESSRLLQRRAEPHGLVERGDVRAVNGHVLHAHHHLPILIPDPLPKELVAADFTPGR